MRQLLIALSATTALAACTTGSVTKSEVAEQTAVVAEAAAGPVTPATAPKAQLGDFGLDVAGMDRNVRPGDEFYDFASANWERTTPIPEDRSAFGMFHVLDDLSTARTREILEEQAKVPGSKIGDFYASFMEREAVEAAGIRPLTPLLQSIKAAPNKGALAAVMGDLARVGLNSPFGNYVDSDDKNPDAAIFQLSQGGLGLPNRDYYLS
ncbi:MAG TPA: M13 family metallopeptidase N-terminal domain-containing protein, partial [Allosphingosinicella sp.]